MQSICNYCCYVMNDYIAIIIIIFPAARFFNFNLSLIVVWFIQDIKH